MHAGKATGVTGVGLLLPTCGRHLLSSLVHLTGEHLVQLLSSFYPNCHQADTKLFLSQGNVDNRDNRTV